MSDSTSDRSYSSGMREIVEEETVVSGEEIEESTSSPARRT